MPRRNLLLILVVAATSWLCYQRAARNRYVGTLSEVMNVVANRYINEVEPRTLFEGAMEGIVHQLDPYSVYTGPEKFQQFQQQLEGELTGIGIMVDADEATGRLTVIESLIGKPAFLAGIRTGDVILAIDGKDAQHLAQKDAIKLIRGKLGTKVKLRVRHLGSEGPVEYEIERSTIPIESVLGDFRGGDGKWVFRLLDHPRIGYVRVINFGERTAEEFHAALASYKRADGPIDGLIVDLRYNPGGLLTAATEICDAFLDKGLIVTTRGRGGVLMEQHEAEPGTDLPREVPIALLVDRLSASASEIVAACLQDHERAAVVGQRTWGKGTVQNVIKLEGGRSAIRLTVGSYHRPSGKEIHKWKHHTDADDWGVRPDPGLEVLLTNHENDLVVLARRQRDLTPLDTLQAAQKTLLPSPTPSSAPPASSPPASPPVPVPQSDAEGQAAEQASSLEGAAAARAKHDPALIDPQLRMALEYLEEHLGEKKVK